MADNYINKISRVYIDTKTFTNDDGREVEFSRLCLKVTIKGTEKVLEFSPAKRKMEDVISFLDLAEDVDVFTKSKTI